jgi:hemolysin III
MRPLLRGYTHQAAFFIALIACAFLIYNSHGTRAIISSLIYSFSLAGLYSISALYHCRLWSRGIYLLLRRIDHAAIFVLIAGTATPVCLLGLQDETGLLLLSIFWIIAIIGMLIAIFWSHAPKWTRSLLYIFAGWLAIPYIPEIQASLSTLNMTLLFLGGIIYTLGALIYAVKWPDPDTMNFFICLSLSRVLYTLWLSMIW